MKPNPVVAAIETFGSEAKLAQALGVSQAAVNKAKRSVERGGRVSAFMAHALDKATGGKVAKHALRPDLFEAPAEHQPAA